MPGKGIADQRMQDLLVIEDPGVIKLIFSKKHNMILKLVMENELSISDIARLLNINPGSVHYHLKDLEKHGLVMQVREEIKGGVVKKFYRSAAKRIVLDSPDFNKMDRQGLIDESALIDRVIGSIEYLGYQADPEKKEDARDMLHRLDRRIKHLLDEIHHSGLDSIEDDPGIIQIVSMMMLIMRTQEDPEIDRIYSEFNKLFAKYG